MKSPATVRPEDTGGKSATQDYDVFADDTGAQVLVSKTRGARFRVGLPVTSAVKFAHIAENRGTTTEGLAASIPLTYLENPSRLPLPDPKSAPCAAAGASPLIVGSHGGEE